MVNVAINEQNKLRYKELDALRGMAAFMVVIFHYTMFQDAYKPIFKFGNTGVDLFFLISGFVIFFSISNISRGIDFIINRISRLYPTYWTAVTFAFLLHILISYLSAHGKCKVDLIQYTANLTMFQSYFNIDDLDWTFWTLIVEMVFYLFMLLIFQLKLLKKIKVIGIIICTLIVLINHFFNDITFVKILLKFLPFLNFMPLFLSGILFYKIYTNKNELTSINYILIIFCYFCQLLLFNYCGTSREHLSWIEYAFMLFAYFSIFTLFVNNKLKFIVNNITLFLGKISYALYLTHLYISTSVIIPFLTIKYHHYNFWLVIMFALVVNISVASFITFYIEIPMRKLLKNKLTMFFPK